MRGAQANMGQGRLGICRQHPVEQVDGLIAAAKAGHGLAQEAIGRHVARERFQDAETDIAGVGRPADP